MGKFYLKLKIFIFAIISETKSQLKVMIINLRELLMKKKYHVKKIIFNILDLLNYCR